MPRVHANGIQLEYDSTGEGRPLLLIMGLGAQMVWWPEAFCEQLAAAGHRVIRFDNRDVGMSTHLEHLPVPRLRQTLVRGLLGLPVEAPYTLVDMADDVAGLLDALGIARAHVAGVSLGGMIAQTLAIVHPSRVSSLTSIMSTTGNRWAGIGRPRAIRTLMGKAPRSREEAIQRHLEFLRVCGSKGFPVDLEAGRERAGRAYDRAFYPRGFARQMAAVMATGDRTAALRFVRTPALVVHGSVDPLIPPRAGRATARAIAGAQLEIIEGMGHDLPEAAWPRIIPLIADHTRRADAAGGSARRAAVHA